jgi:adenine-specific DNA-methyltransferase
MKTLKEINCILKEHRSLLTKKCVEKNKGNRPWHVLFRARDEELFQVPKILFRQTGDSIIACIDHRVNYYGIDSVNIGILKNAFVEQKKYILGILNSKLITFIYRNVSQEGGRVLAQVKPQRIRVLPIAFPEKEKRKPLEKLVECILDITKEDDYIISSQKQAKVKSLEAEIDQLVYKLYDLTPEEIKILEGGN